MLHVRALGRRLGLIWAEVPLSDWGTSCVIVAVHIAYGSQGHSASIFDSIPADRRSDVYMTTASISALIGGFGTAAISQYATAGGRRMLELRRRFGSSLRKNWVGILASMLFISAVCLFALIKDNSSKVGFVGPVVEASLVLGVLRSARLVWLFSMLIDIADYDVTEPVRSPAIRIPRTRRDQV
jgi:hypothetical protein